MSTWLKMRRRQDWPDERLRQALAPFSRRVRIRYTLESIRLALTWGLALAAILLTLLHWTPLPALKLAVLSGGLLAAIIVAWRWYRRPDALTVAVLADDQGLKGGAITALRLLQGEASGVWEQAALAEALAGCRSINADSYPVLPAWHYWRGILILLGVIIGLALTPNPLLPFWAERRAEQAALAAAAAEADRIVEPLSRLARDEVPLLLENQFYQWNRSLDSLARQVREAGSRQEGAAVLEQAGQELSLGAAELLPAAQEAAKLSALWQGQQGAAWQQLARALDRGDAGAARQAAEELWQQVSGLLPGSDAAREAALSFWRGAEATEQPQLRQALRQAAAALEKNGGPGEDARDNAAGAATGSGADGDKRAAGEALATALANLATSVRAQAEMTAAADSLGQLARGLAGGAPGSMLAGGGTALAPGNSAAAAGSSPGGAGAAAGAGQGAGGIAAAPGPVGAAGGAYAGGSGTGADSPVAAGHSPGSSSSVDGGSAAGGGGDGQGGTGDSGGGQGSGRGPGGQGGGGSSAGSGSAGLEQGYAPFLPGGEGFLAQVQATVGAGEAGLEVSQPWSPAALGAVPFYEEVYPFYVARARETISRSPLPPPLEKLVWQYFSAIEPPADHTGSP